MNQEFQKLTQEQQAAVRRMIAAARDFDLYHYEDVAGGTAYAYRGVNWRVHWGLNGPDGGAVACGMLVREGETL